jgi:hypothetical protein
MGPDNAHDRRWQAYKLRHEAAMAHSNQPFPSFPTNGDEEAYPNKIASYTKCLPHNERGEVDLTAYDALLKALATGQHAAFEAIPMGGKLKFANPQAAYAFELEGPDPDQVAMPAPPAFSSAETASEMIELYWQALTRDVPFAEYDSHALTDAAAADLSKCSTAGACVTVLKAFFNESFIIPNPVVASPDGLSLTLYRGSNLTVGGELNKLAANIALGRNTAGVHWRSDGREGLKLGEAVAVGILRDLRMTCRETFDGFSFTKFDGSTVTI